MGLIERLSDIEQIVIGAEHGIPVFVRQVAEVKMGMPSGPAPSSKAPKRPGRVVARYGVSTIDDQPSKRRSRPSKPGCPRGSASCPSTTARTIARAVDTLKRALLEETLIVTLAHMSF